MNHSGNIIAKEPSASGIFSAFVKQGNEQQLQFDYSCSGL